MDAEEANFEHQKALTRLRKEIQDSKLQSQEEIERMVGETKKRVETAMENWEGSWA